MPDPTHLSLPDAAYQMGVSADTLRRMVQEGAVPRWAVVASGRTRPRHYIARAWLESRATAPVEPQPAMAYTYAVQAVPVSP